MISPSRSRRKANPWGSVGSPEALQFRRTVAFVRYKRLIVDCIFVAGAILAVCFLVYVAWNSAG